MTSDYAALAAIYEQLGMAEFARSITPRLLTYVQQREWMGRRILDIGTGTGASLAWFSSHHYLATGLDHEPAMIEKAQQSLQAQGLSAELLTADMRDFSGVDSMDMALALDALNELASLRELEQVMGAVHGALGPGKLFIFDLHTTEGLLSGAGDGERLLLDEALLLVLERSAVDYERQVQSRHYTIFSGSGAHWQRSEAQRILRAYPVQAVMSLLKRCGFAVNHVLDTRLNPVEPGAPGAQRVILITQKQ